MKFYAFATTLLIIINAIIIMSLLLDVRPKHLSFVKRIIFFAGAISIVLIQLISMIFLKVEVYVKLYLILAQLPTLFLFCAVSKRGFVKPLFVMLTTIFLCSPGTITAKIFLEIFDVSHYKTLLAVVSVDAIMILVIWKYMKPNFDYILDTFSVFDILKFSATPLLYNLILLSTGGYLLSQQDVKTRVLIS